MRKPLMFLAAAAFLLVAATWWSVDVPVIIGGKEMVALFRPEALPLLYGALALFAIALVIAIHTAFRDRTRRTPPPETTAAFDRTAPATD